MNGMVAWLWMASSSAYGMFQKDLFGHGNVQRFGVPSPGDSDGLGFGFADTLADGHHICKALAWVMHGAFKVDDGHGGVLGKAFDDGVLAVDAPRFAFGEGAHSQNIYVARQHACSIFDVFGVLAVHDDAFAVF